ncbi:MAG: P1 family peptidase [Chloroflexi bacterium]|nr:P1 family peptidase [Chloroflexota bacterium]
MTNQTLTAVAGIAVGHAHKLEGPTGCTVVLCPEGTIGGVDQRGGAPGTRETDLLRPMHMVEHVNAVLLTGGSAFGLDAAAGVMRFLEAKGQGFPVGTGVVPIVPAAVIFDLDLGNPEIRPDADLGYSACENASGAPVAEGCVGAGAGARVGTLAGLPTALKSGIGSAAVDLGDGLVVAALFVVNAIGDVLDEDGRILAGARLAPDASGPEGFIGSMNIMRNVVTLTQPPTTAANTVIGVVTTNGQLTKDEANKVAQMAHDGLARAIQPAHTMFDGDTVFALATGSGPRVNVSAIGAFAAEVTATAIRRAVQQATPLAGLPAISTERR